MIGDAVRTAAKERCDVQQLQAIYRTVDDAVSKYAHRHHFVHSEARVKSEIKRLADREVAFVLFPEKPKGASMDEVEGLIAHKTNNDVASIVASVQWEPVPPATVVDAVKDDVKALLKTKGPSHINLKSKSGVVSEIKIDNHLDKAFNLVRDTAIKVSAANTESYPLLHKFREDIKRPDGARACTQTRCGVTLPARTDLYIGGRV